MKSLVGEAAPPRDIYLFLKYKNSAAEVLKLFSFIEGQWGKFIMGININDSKMRGILIERYV